MVNSRKAPNAAPQSVPLPPKMALRRSQRRPRPQAQAKTRLGIDCANGRRRGHPRVQPMRRSPGNATKTAG